MDNLSYAKKYLDHGFSVIPLKSNSKIPLIAWKWYQTNRPTDEQLSDWFRNRPDINVGIVTGEISGIDVVDFDSHELFRNIFGEQPPLPCVITPRGVHIYIPHQSGSRDAVGLIRGVDYRGNGGYVVAPPSTIHGHEYRWASNNALKMLQHGFVLPNALSEIISKNKSRIYSYNSIHSINSIDSIHSINSIDSIHSINSIDSIHSINSTHPEFGNDSDKIRISVGDSDYSEKSFPLVQGQRDNALFHLANCLIKGGMSPAEAEVYVRLFASQCQPPYPENEAAIKVQSALKRAMERERNLLDDLGSYIDHAVGTFTVHDVYSFLGVTNKDDRKKVLDALRYYAKKGILEKSDRRSGVYRKIDDELKEIDYLSADVSPVDLWLPLDLHNMVNIYWGNVILIGGSTGSGKTCICLNIIKHNMHKYDIHYFNSEMSSSELRKRLSNFTDVDLETGWRFKPWERYSDFADVVRRGEGVINIIDYIEEHDMTEVSWKIKEIHEKLNGAIAIVCLQKKRQSDVPFGGEGVFNKPRLALAVNAGQMKIAKTKDFKTLEKPDGKVRDFKIINGGDIIGIGNWHYEI